MYVGYVVFLDGNPKKLLQTGRDIPRSVLRVRRSYSASSNVLTIHAGSAFFCFFLFFWPLSNFSGSNENPNTRKREKKKNVFVPKKKRLMRPLFMGAESCEKSESLSTFGRTLWSITLFAHARCGRLWGDESFVHGSGGMRRRVGSKFKRSGHPHARPKNRTRSPSPARSTWHAADNAKRPARPTNQYGTQSGGIQQSACAANRTHARPHGRIYLRSSQTCLEVRRSVRLR